ncbi:unnamed protein product [Rotaria sp. Silwood1]|nr:unnamed protein product [Rotaria sp. Silwood1]
MQRSQNFNNNTRGSFQNRRDQTDNRDHGEFGRRGQRGGQRGGGFTNNRGGSDRNNFRDRDNTGLQLSLNNNNTTKTFNNFSTIRTTNINFEAGDHFIENEIPKDIFKYVISHIETVNDFFIQILSKGDELSILSETLQNEYSQAPEVNLSSLKIGQACLAKSVDNCWYRAVVVLTDINKIKVRFIDFGDTTEVNSKTIRQLEKKHCLASPYAYQCKFENIQILNNVNIEIIINQCAGKEFQGKIKLKTSDNKFILESDDFLQILLQTNAIKLKSENTLKRLHCFIVHIESNQHEFFIQDDKETVDKIADLINKEISNTPTLTIDEVNQLLPNTIVIATFENEPYRAIIQSNESNNDNINVCYIDYGNTNICSKTSLKSCSEQLSSYPYQSKRCQLYGIKSNEIDNAFQYIEDKSDSENIEISIINEKNSLFNVILYIDNECINEKFGYDINSIENIIETHDQSSISTTTTTIESKEQEQQILVDDKQTNDDILSQNETSIVSQPENNEPMIEAIDDIIQYIPITESITIHIENHDENNQCLFVTLIRENNDNINAQYLLNDKIEDENKQESDTNEKNEIILSNSSDIVNIDEQKTSQIENNNNNDQSDDITNVTENSSSLSMSNNNQTIDFGENDSLTTIKDETNDSISSN